MLLIPLPSLSAKPLRPRYSIASHAPDPSCILVAISIIPFKDANGAITGIAAMMRDVTKRFEELKAMRKQLASVKG
jgi:hypothetical protein